MNLERLQKQIAFIIEIDKLKHVLRRTITIDCERHENDAEHSWHVAVMAVLLSEYAKPKEIDVLRVVKMAVIHDLVEIDAGDTYCYGNTDDTEKLRRETMAADRIFNILPSDQAKEFRSLWDEFEAQTSPESRFAAALDRFQPLLLNYYTDGKSWKKHGVTSKQVLARNRPVVESAPILWEYAARLIDDAVRKGMLAE